VSSWDHARTNQVYSWHEGWSAARKAHKNRLLDACGFPPRARGLPLQIGVHSAKFENEKETENIREAVGRYGVKHSVRGCVCVCVCLPVPVCVCVHVCMCMRDGRSARIPVTTACLDLLRRP
jgi:hypothetical protein